MNGTVQPQTPGSRDELRGLSITSHLLVSVRDERLFLQSPTKFVLELTSGIFWIHELIVFWDRKRVLDQLAINAFIAACKRVTDCL